jgi:hypothetical protein
MSIVADSEGICTRLESGAGAAVEASTPTPEMLEETPLPGG